MAQNGVITTSNIDVTVREIDFVERFQSNFAQIQEMLGVVRPIRKENGAKIRVLKTTGTLQQSVGEGEVIPFSEYSTEVAAEYDVSVDKKATAVTLEAVKEFGYEVAVARKDTQFLNDLQATVLGNFYTFLATGELVPEQADADLRAALAGARGALINKFRSIHKGLTEIVAFVNANDMFAYLGDKANGSLNAVPSTVAGEQILRDFLGYRTVFLCSDDEIAPGTVIATPVENINMYYVDPSDSEYARIGLQYTTQGDTNLIGFHTEGNYSRAQGESYALLGVSFFAELLDGIAVRSFS